MNLAKLADVAISPKGLCGSGCDVALTRMTKLFTGYALDMSLPGGTTTVPDAIKAGAVNLVDSFKSLPVRRHDQDREDRRDPPAARADAHAPLLLGAVQAGQRPQRRGTLPDDDHAGDPLGGEGLHAQDALAGGRVRRAVRGDVRRRLRPRDQVRGDGERDDEVEGRPRLHRARRPERDGLGRLPARHRDVGGGRPLRHLQRDPAVGERRVHPAQGRCRGKAGSHAATFKLPSNIKATFDAWGGCACGGEISFDPLYDAIFDGLLQPIFADNFTFAPGDATDDVIPFAKRLVPYLLGPQFLCGGKCKAAFGSTLRVLFDVRSARAFLRDADIFLGFSLDVDPLWPSSAILTGRTINLGGLPKLDTIIGASIPDTLPIKIGSLSSCICGVGEAGWETAIDGVVDFLGWILTTTRANLPFGHEDGGPRDGSTGCARPTLCSATASAPRRSSASSTTSTRPRPTSRRSSASSRRRRSPRWPAGDSGPTSSTSRSIKDVADQIGSLLPAKEKFVEMAKLAVHVRRGHEHGAPRRRADADRGGSAGATRAGFAASTATRRRRIVATGVIDTMTVCSASEAQKAEPPKPNAMRFAVTAAKKDDEEGGRPHPVQEEPGGLPRRR